MTTGNSSLISIFARFTVARNAFRRKKAQRSFDGDADFRATPLGANDVELVDDGCLIESFGQFLPLEAVASGAEM